MRTPLTQIECRACKTWIGAPRALRVPDARRFAREHEPHGQLYASITVRSGGSGSTVTAHVRSRRPGEPSLTPAEKVAGALFADVVDAYERLMERDS